MRNLSDLFITQLSFLGAQTLRAKQRLVVLDVSTEETRLDLVAGGFDAGVQYGEFIQQDMVAVRVSPDHRPAIVGSPA
jgi:DNA-binding transcriptional LysR family regulator